MTEKPLRLHCKSLRTIGKNLVGKVVSKLGGKHIGHNSENYGGKIQAEKEWVKVNDQN